KGHGLPVALRAIRLDLFEPCAATPYLAAADRALDCDCDIGLVERVRCSDDMRMPGAFAEVEVMLPVARHGCLSYRRWPCRLRRLDRDCCLSNKRGASDRRSQ